MLREAFASDDLDPAGVYFGTQSGSVFALADEGDRWAEVAAHLPPILSVEAGRVVVVKLPSLLADQADGQREFEVEASTVGEALRGLPVADLLLDERGDLRTL